MRSFEAFKFNQDQNKENDEQEKTNPENELISLRKKQIDCISMPEELEDDFLELKEKEKSGEINPIDLNRLRSMKEKYWTKEDQEKLLSLTEEKNQEGDEYKRFLELSRKQINNELTDGERDEIKKLYNKF